MTEKGNLIYGVEYPAGSGQLHYAFELRLSTVGDNINAIEEVGLGNHLKLNAAMMAYSLLKLGDIPYEQITPELINQLVDDDYDVLSEARDALKKKRKQQKNSSAATASPSSPSASTASPSRASVN